MVAHGLRIFKLLSARWKRRREEGGRGRGGGGAGGASEQHIYICISPLRLVIRGKNQLPPKILWRRRMYYLFSSSTNIRKQFAHLFVLVFTFARTAWIWIVWELFRIWL